MNDFEEISLILGNYLAYGKLNKNVFLEENLRFF